jgi:hypothetical protein
MKLLSLSGTIEDNLISSIGEDDEQLLLLIIHIKEPVTDQRTSNNILKFANILRSRTFWAGDNIKADPITFSQGLESFSLDRGMMHEKIFAPFLLDKTKPLRIIKPLHSSFRHL